MHWWKQHNKPLANTSLRPSTKAIHFSIQSRSFISASWDKEVQKPEHCSRWSLDLGNSRLLASTMSSWHFNFLCKWWKVVAPPQWNVCLYTRLLYMMTSIHPYMRTYRYIYHTPNSYTNKMNQMNQINQMNQLSGSELYGILWKKNASS